MLQTSWGGTINQDRDLRNNVLIKAIQLYLDEKKVENRSSALYPTRCDMLRPSSTPPSSGTSPAPCILHRVTCFVPALPLPLPAPL